MRIKIIDEVEFCCEKMRKYYESHNVKFDTKDEAPIYFYKMIYKGKPIDVCPFCKSYGLEKGYYKRCFLKIPIVCKKCGRVSREICYSK